MRPLTARDKPPVRALSAHTMQAAPHFRAAALDLAASNIRAFPLAERSKLPKIPKWAGGNGCHDGTTDLEQIEAWWSKWPHANIGVSTGAGLHVVDADGVAGALTLSALRDEYGPLPVTMSVSTGREDGGRHFWFRTNGERLGNKKLGPGLDTRGDGGYVVAPPSVHPSGAIYASDGLEIADAPAWLVDLLREDEPAPTTPRAPRVHSSETSNYGRAALEGACREIARQGEGWRNEFLFRKARWIFELEAGGEIAGGDATTDLEDAARRSGLASREIEATLKSARARAVENPRKAPESAPWWRR